MHEYFRHIIKQCADRDFLKGVCRKYHYHGEDIELLTKVAEKMKPLMLRQAVWEHRLFQKAPYEDYEELAEAVMTLGSEIDLLQEDYLRKGLLSEAYMMEALGSELLLCGYQAYNQWVADNTTWHVARYHFIGSEEEYPIEYLPELLERLGVPVTCNEAFCMLPKKSVAFIAELTQDGQVRCPGICVGCNSKGCPNRMTSAGGRHALDMTDRPMPYGYARIFGKEYS